MDISYHYFAVKSLAREAGFTEGDAQIIAVFSQFIDDYNAYKFCNYSNIPNYAKKAPYDIYIDRLWNPFNFNPVTTGFWDMVDLTLLITSRSQKFTVSPFHFIPQSIERVNAKDFRTKPATQNDGSYISDMLTTAKKNFIEAQAGASKQHTLMHIGMLLHTFADTYAHQLFSGYNEDCNLVKLKKVINNTTGDDETQKYNDSIVKWLDKIRKIIPQFTPAIGHMMLNHIPDLTHLSFIMEYPLQGENGNGTHSRSNTAEFVRASKEIVNFLRSCLGKDSILDNEWERLSERMARGFLFDISNMDEKESIKALKKHWGETFKDKTYSYEYDRTTVFGGILSELRQNDQVVRDDHIQKSMNDDFYRYNAYADELLIELYGSQPRKEWFNNPSEFDTQSTIL